MPAALLARRLAKARTDHPPGLWFLLLCLTEPEPSTPPGMQTRSAVLTRRNESAAESLRRKLDTCSSRTGREKIRSPRARRRLSLRWRPALADRERARPPSEPVPAVPASLAAFPEPAGPTTRRPARLRRRRRCDGSACSPSQLVPASYESARRDSW